MKLTGRTAAMVAVAGLAMSAGSARAALLSWNNAIGGAAATSTNWAPVAVPTAADDLTFAMAGSYAVTFSNLVPSSRTMAFRTGTVTLTMSSPHTTSNGLAIADLAGDTATVTLTTGSWSSGPAGFVNVGDAGGTNGTFNINDADADFAVLGTSDLFVGNNGIGTMNITGGGTATLADTMHVGQGSAATGNLTVSGALSTPPFGRSTLNVNGAGESRWGNGGDATVSIANGALAHFAGTLAIGNLSTSLSVVTVGGAGFIFNATLDVDGNLFIARNSSAAVLPGTGTLTVNDNGDVTVSGAINVGNDPDNGGNGTLNVNSGAFVSATDVVDGAFGTINHTGGTLQINGGTYTGHADPLVVTGTGSPTLELSSNLSKTLTPAGTVALIVGDNAGLGSFSGTLLIDSGADLIIAGTSKDIQIGDDTGTTGTILVDGAGSRLVADQPGDDIRVGVNGAGTLAIDHGGQALTNNILVPGTASGGNGLLIVSNAGSTLTTANLTVGNSLGSTGQVTINPEGTMTATNPAVGVLVRTTGSVDIAANAVLNATGDITLTGGQLSVAGTVNAGTVDVQSGLLESLNGGLAPLVDAPALFRSGGALEVNFNDLTIGDSTSTAGFNAQDGSTITIGARTLTILDADHAYVDDVTINGGAIIAPNGIEIITPGTNGTLTGTGTITTSDLFFTSGGSVITATGASGITINGKFRNNSGSIDGTKYTFNNNPAITDSGWTGAGTIDAQVVFNAGTKVNALGNMAMGTVTPLGVTFNSGSELHADTRIVTLLDSNGVGFGALTTINGGDIICAQQLVLSNPLELRGHGDLQTPLFLMNGRVKVGPLPALNNDIATLRVNGANGTITMSGSAIYDADLGLDFKGFHSGDKVIATGPLTIAGTVNVGLVPGFVPAAPDVITIAKGSTRTGTFATTNLPAVGAFGPAHVEYTATSVNVVMCYANCDGSQIAPALNVNDFICFQNRFAAASALPLAQQISNYANCDQSTLAPVLNVNDFTCFLNKFAVACN